MLSITKIGQMYFLLNEQIDYVETKFISPRFERVLAEMAFLNGILNSGFSEIIFKIK